MKLRWTNYWKMYCISANFICGHMRAIKAGSQYTPLDLCTALRVTILPNTARLFSDRLTDFMWMLGGTNWVLDLTKSEITACFSEGPAIKSCPKESCSDLNQSSSNLLIYNVRYRITILGGKKTVRQFGARLMDKTSEFFSLRLSV